MKIKTNKLIGAALDWAVAKCEPGALCNWPNYTRLPGYSTDWSQGGPIIERELIGTGPRLEGSIWPEPWLAASPEDDAMFWGPTPLIAAMRCYVTSKLGDEVEVPEELLS